MSALVLHGMAEPAPSIRLYDGKQTARAVGLSWERFRKVRLDWTRDRDFPAELSEPGEPVRYLADAVDAWLLRRSRRVHPVADVRIVTPALPAPEDHRIAARGRAALRSLKGGDARC